MEFLYSQQKLSILELEEFEQKFKIKLPQGYKNFILQYNGGQPKPNMSFGIRVHMFQSIKYYETFNNTVEDTIEMLQILEQVLPEHLFPFAHDEGGNQLCISLSEDDYGSVYMCYFDYGEPIPIHYLCSSFEEFMNGFH